MELKTTILDKAKPTFFEKHQNALYKSLEDKHTTVEVEEDPLGTRMILNMGPQHPATHGVLRLLLELDGERIIRNRLDIGYLHRGVEKIAENKTYQEFMPYTDRMDYLSPYSNNVALCLAVEKLAQIEVPERADYIRMIGCELARISSHLLYLGAMVMDTGAISFFIWTFRERERLYDIFDNFGGHRFTISHSRIGGVHNDLSPECLGMIKNFIDTFPDEIRDWKKLLNKNRIFYDRNLNVGRISYDEALALGVTGPNIRAVGVPYDIRKFDPYLQYDQVEFDVPTRLEGDNLARYFIRMEEMSESVRIIRQCLEKMPKGPIRTDNAKQAYPSKDEVYYSMEGMIHDFMMTDTGICPPEGAEAYHAIEAPKGELGFFIQSDGTGHPWRLKIKSPSFTNLQGLEKMLDGEMIADTVVMIGGVDPVMGDSDK
ncbi:MAG: NADH dehydrogenase (quinone) subunit D [Candidatus Cyclonatronum sp.]|uniref:NADH dehydrogenase (quinone) subunit D n=1 Tax=Cyclonatronum sp. TaxID=3024185 RepID=UPI0025C45099|nr:NADH dehydrogenase (quinone) subunit D [Cyclonatronum sp.]MCH8486669.1 NADH dehydrogenase (quinone) subunit D [Cyclonatronum sp.]